MKSIAVAKEIMPGEQRVILTPESVRAFHDQGFDVYVQENAGYAAGFPDQAYKAVGAKIVDNRDIWYCSKLLIKFKAPQISEYLYLHEGLNIGAYMHAEGNMQLVKELCKKKVTAYAFEFFKTLDDIFPMSVIDSEIAGKLAVIYGMYHLQKPYGGSGILLSNIVGVKKPKALVIGYGNAGNAAIRLLEALDVDVVVLGRNMERLRKYQATVRSNVTCLKYTPEILRQEIKDADLVIGAIQISTFDTPPILTDEMVMTMKKGSMIVDVTCGYGPGYLPSFDHFSNFSEPVYERFGVLHCKIDLLPAAVPVTTTQGVSKHITPYLINWANAVWENSTDIISLAGKIISEGEIVHEVVKMHKNFYDQQKNL